MTFPTPKVLEIKAPDREAEPGLSCECAIKAEGLEPRSTPWMKYEQETSPRGASRAPGLRCQTASHLADHVDTDVVGAVLVAP